MFHTPRQLASNNHSAFTNYRGDDRNSTSDDDSVMVVSPAGNLSPDDGTIYSAKRMDWDDDSVKILNDNSSHIEAPHNNFVGGLEDVFNSPFFSGSRNQKHISEGRTNRQLMLNWPTMNSSNHQRCAFPRSQSSSNTISPMRTIDHSFNPYAQHHHFHEQIVPSCFNDLTLNEKIGFNYSITMDRNNSSNSTNLPTPGTGTSLFGNIFLNDLNPHKDDSKHIAFQSIADDFKPTDDKILKAKNIFIPKSPTPPSPSSLLSLPPSSSYSIPAPPPAKLIFPPFSKRVQPTTNSVNNSGYNYSSSNNSKDDNNIDLNTIDYIDNSGDVNMQDFKSAHLFQRPGPPVRNGIESFSGAQNTKDAPISCDDNNEIPTENNIRFRHVGGKIMNDSKDGRISTDNIYFIRNDSIFSKCISLKTCLVLLFLFLLCLILHSFMLNSDYQIANDNTRGSEYSDNHKPINFTTIENNLNSKLFGQHIASNTILTSLKNFLPNQDGSIDQAGDKVLSFVFLGSSGVGKSYAGSLIMEGFIEAKAAHIIIIPLHFSYLVTLNRNNNNNKDDDDDDGVKKFPFKKKILELIDAYKHERMLDNLMQGSRLLLSSSASSSSSSVLLFIIEGLDDVLSTGADDDDDLEDFVSQIINTITCLNKRNCKSNASEDGDSDDDGKNNKNNRDDSNDDDGDGFKYIFIITSNLASSTINKLTYNLVTIKKVLRNEITMDMVMEDQTMIDNLSDSWFYKAFHKKNIDHIIPFLPLEKEHVGMCISSLLQQRNITIFDNRNFVDSVFKAIGNYPKNGTAIFSLAGCRKVPSYVDLLLAGFQ